MVTRQTSIVRAHWDDEAKTWVATSVDMPGLVTEARSHHELIKKLSVLVTEWLRENGRDDIDDVTFSVISERKVTIPRPSALLAPEVNFSSDAIKKIIETEPSVEFPEKRAHRTHKNRSRPFRASVFRMRTRLKRYVLITSLVLVTLLATVVFLIKSVANY